jgi:hypothetical protein
MSDDALFQLGMGPVGLAPQKEESFERCAATAHAGVFRPAPARIGLLMRRRGGAEPACARAKRRATLPF